MAENFELLETGQIELMHQQTHDRQGEAENCDMLRSQHDTLAAVLVTRGIAHDTEMICPESALARAAPNYQRGFTDDICVHCAFGQLFSLCNLYKEDYTADYVCDSFRYFEVLELEPPHGFLMANGKETAHTSVKPLDIDKAYLIVSNGEAFGIAEFEQPAQLKTKQFDAEEWQLQHRVTQRERRQWWPDTEIFYVYRVKAWHPYDGGIKLFEDGQVIDEPKLTSRQWQMISAAKQLPKQIIIENDFIELTSDYKGLCGDKSFYNREAKTIIDATFNQPVDHVSSCGQDEEIVPIYSLALVRNPRMRVSKKNLSPEGATEKQEGDENMPFGIHRNDDGEYCVINTDTDESMGCHDTEEEAEAQLTALRINVEADESEAALHTDKPRKHKPRKKDTVSVHVSEYEHMEIKPKGEKVLPPIEQPEKGKRASFIEGLQNVAKSIGDFLKSAESEEDEVKLFVNKAGIAQKMVNGELWHFTYSTNAFEDREGETFSTKSLERYVAGAKENEDRGFFNLWHIQGTDFARKEWQDVIGRFLVEAGPYLENEKGQAAREFFKQFGGGHPELAPEGWGCSPEFRYLPKERATTVYENIWITRTSTLPKMAAANIWTETRQLARKDMSYSDEQIKTAIAVFQDKEFVKRLYNEGETKTADLEAAGVAHKEKATPEPQPQEIQLNMEDLAAEVGKQFTADLSPIADAITTMVSSVKEIEGRLEKLEGIKQVKDVTEKPRFVFNLERASEAEETKVTDDDKLIGMKPVETKGNSGDPWSQVFGK